MCLLSNLAMRQYDQFKIILNKPDWVDGSNESDIVRNFVWVDGKYTSVINFIWKPPTGSPIDKANCKFSHKNPLSSNLIEQLVTLIVMGLLFKTFMEK